MTETTPPKGLCLQTEPQKLFWHMTVAERREWVRGLITDGTYKYDQNLPIDELFHEGQKFVNAEWEYYGHRIQLENSDPAIAVKYIDTVNDARFFMDSYGLERAKPYLSSYLWIAAYRKSNGSFENNALTKRDIGLLIQDRGVEKVCEEIRGRSPEQIERMLILKDWADSFIELFGLKAVAGLPPELAKKIKSRHLEDALGL